MPKVTDLFANLGLRSTEFTKGLRKAVDEARAAGKTMSTAFGKEPQRAIIDTERQVKRSLSGMRSAFKDTSRVVTGILISQTFYAGLRRIQDATASVIDFNAEMENARIAFSLLFKDAAKADRFISALKQFAAVTPFQFEQARAAAQQMLAMGFQAESILPTLRTILDASAVAGGSPEVIERIARALGQIQAAGRLSARDLLQLVDAGIPVIEILQEELGMVGLQLDEIGKKNIPAEVGIKALLTGIQKRFGGASEAMAQTYKGLMSTIKDNLLLLSEGVFGSAFAGLKESVKQFKEFTDELLKAMQTRGVGGLFERLFPPEFHGTIRVVIAGFIRLKEVTKTLFAALKPLMDAVGQYFLRALGLILPALSLLVTVIAKIAYWATTTSPVLKMLAGAITGLFIAGLASAAITALTTAIKKLAVASIVAKAILLLKNAITLLSAAMTKNPIIATIMIISMALLSIALSSETASRALDRLSVKLAKIFGINVDNLLQPLAVTKEIQAVEEFNKSLLDTAGGVGAIGDEADGSKKKIDNFLASFDEVYNIPEKLDGAGGSGVDFKIPEGLSDLSGAIPVFGEDGLISEEEADKDIDGLLDKIERKFNRKSIRIKFDPPTGGNAVVESVEAILKVFGVAVLKVAELKKSLKDFAEETGQILSSFATEAIDSFKQWTTNTYNNVLAWSVLVGSILSTFMDPVKQRIIETLNNIKTNLQDDLTSIASFWEEHKVTVLLIVGALIGGVALFFFGLPATLTTALATIFALIVTNFVDTKVAVAAELDETKQNIKTKWEEVRDNLAAIWKSIKGTAKSVWTSITDTIKGSINYIIKILNKFIDYINNIKINVPSISIPFVGTFGGYTISMPQIPKIPELAEGGIVDRDSIVDTKVAAELDETKQNIKTKWEEVRDNLAAIWKSIKGTAKSVWTSITDTIKESINYIIKIPKIPELAEGGIVDRDSIVRITERNKPESVVPLSEEGLRPFAQALAGQLGTAGGQNSNQLPVVYVQNFIADNRSLKELERKLNIIRMNEAQRRGEV